MNIAVLTFEDCQDPACTQHPHCVCGARLQDDGAGELVCDDCGTAVLAEVPERAEVAR